MKKIILMLIILPVFTTVVFSQNVSPNYVFKDETNPAATQDISTSIYAHFLLDIDLTPKFDSPLTDAVAKKSDCYFVVATHADKKIFSIASYDKDKNLSNFLLDREFNIYFAFIKIEYNASNEAHNISKMTLYDNNGKELSYIEYKWEEKPEGSKKYLLRTVTLYQYSGDRRDFIKVQSRRLIYGGGAFGNKGIGEVDWNSTSTQYAKDLYGKSPTMVSYTRYDEGGQVQYTRNLTYKGQGISDVQTYNKEGVLISEEKPSDTAPESAIPPSPTPSNNATPSTNNDTTTPVAQPTP